MEKEHVLNFKNYNIEQFLRFICIILYFSNANFNFCDIFIGFRYKYLFLFIYIYIKNRL